MIPLFKPSLGDGELKALRAIFKSGWIGLGPRTEEFEKRFASFIGTRYAVGLNSCTAALDLALKVLNLPKGSEVVVPAITFISCAHAVRYNNLTSVFVDVDANTLVLDPDAVERSITKRTRAIMAVHFAGQVCDMDPIMRIARRRKLFVIEDCANAAGSQYKGAMVGSIGDLGCFSFEAKKNMTTGDGGMITLNRKDWNERLRRLRWLGINRDTWKRFRNKKSYSWYYEVAELGYKYNMNDIQGAIGLVQLSKLSTVQRKKHALVARYNRAFAGIDGLQLLPPLVGSKPHWWLYIVRVSNRDRFMGFLRERGITTGVHFMPLQLHPLYRSMRAHTPVALREWRRMVTLPLYADMRPHEQKKIIEAVQAYFMDSRASDAKVK